MSIQESGGADVPIKEQKKTVLQARFKKQKRKERRRSKQEKSQNVMNPYFKWWKRFVLSPMNPKGKLLSEGRFAFFQIVTCGNFWQSTIILEFQMIV